MTRPIATAHPAVRLIAPALLLLSAGLPGAALAQARSGAMVCTTTLEAPQVAAGGLPMAPVEVTRCNPAMTMDDVIQRRFFAYTAPFARGVDITHQITDFLGISMGGGDGTRVMGFGFPDQTIVWDGTALNNLYNRMMDAQTGPMPLRTPDLSNPYRTSVGMSPYSSPPQDPLSVAPLAMPSSSSWSVPVRGLW